MYVVHMYLDILKKKCRHVLLSLCEKKEGQKGGREGGTGGEQEGRGG